jgi:hypothetical protein
VQDRLSSQPQFPLSAPGRACPYPDTQRWPAAARPWAGRWHASC